MIQTLNHVSEYKEELIYPAICRAFDALDIEKDMRPGLKVAIKPNLILAKSPDVPVTTHPLVIKAVARWLNEHGVTDITLAESSGGLYNAEYMGNIYRVCGMKQLEPQVRLNMDFSAKTVNCPEAFANHSFHIITPILEADYVINICKLKTHAMTGYSGGIKNLFGTIPGLEKPQLHYLWPDIKDFSRMLVELAQTVNPQVTVIDAIDAMEGNGPTGGTSHPLHMILAARDFYTQDYFAAKLMGLDPMNIEMIAQAVTLGLAKPDELKLIGDPIPDNLTPFQVPDSKKLDFSNYLPGPLGKIFAKFAAGVLKSYPQLDDNLCVGCGKCAESCPAHIIEIKNRKAVFKKKGCISCFCCQEMCPMKAISVKKAL
ncbi:MAG: DUF362 domain-containing protein [Lachnospiraceae bacterium]|nr:DUF362 domain-containing protein [Lachnospiraceae bacterium]